MKTLRALMALSVLCVTFSIMGCGGAKPGDTYIEEKTRGEMTKSIPDTAEGLQDIEPGK